MSVPKTSQIRGRKSPIQISAKRLEIGGISQYIEINKKHIVWLWTGDAMHNRMALPTSEMGDGRSSQICGAVERPDRHCGADLVVICDKCSGGPQSGHSAVCRQVAETRPDIKLISVGQLIADGLSSRQPDDVDWDDVNSKITDGELAPDVRAQQTFNFVSVVVLSVCAIFGISVA